MHLKLEKFTKTSSLSKVVISIRKNGDFGMHLGAVNKFGLSNGVWFVVLYFDKASRTIGIQPTKNPKEEGAIRLVRRAKSGRGRDGQISSSIPAKSFMVSHGIKCNRSQTFQAEWNDKLAMILINIDGFI